LKYFYVNENYVQYIKHCYHNVLCRTQCRETHLKIESKCTGKKHIANVMTTATNIFAAFRRDLSWPSGFPPPDNGISVERQILVDTINYYKLINSLMIFFLTNRNKAFCHERWCLFLGSSFCFDKKYSIKAV